MKFRSDIEGLRAVAIIPVVLYHTNASLVPGGYVGVDVFFVVSGFLISRIILEDVTRGSFSYLTFYRRRIRRIFPALFFMLLVVSAAAFIILPPAALIEYGQTLVATAFFVSNMEFYRLSGYFGGAAELKPLLHTWSLAVEEQFYIFFPIVLLATRRWLSSRFGIVIVACAITSFFFCGWLEMRHPNAAFYFGPSRAFELMVGAVLALDQLPKLTNRFSQEIVGTAGLGAIMISAFGFDHTTSFPVPGALPPCIGAAAIIYSGQTAETAMANFLSLRPIRFFGSISYSLYLWHWPLLSLARNYFLNPLTPFQTSCAVALAIAMAVFSRQLIENPFLSEERRTKSIFGPAGAVTIGVAAFGVVLFLGAGIPERFSPYALRLFGYSGDFNQRRSECHDEPNHVIPYDRNCYFGTSRARAVVAVWGDSQGAELSVALGDAVAPALSVMEITSSGCPPAVGFNSAEMPTCAAHNQETVINLVHDGRIRDVLLIARYSAYDQSGKWPSFKRGFEKAISELSASGKRILVIYPVPGFPRSVPETIGMMVSRGLPPGSYKLDLASYRAENAAAIEELNAVTAKFHVRGVGTQNILCGKQYCSTYDGRDVLYFDDSHMSVSGARKLAAAIKPLL